MEFKTLNHNQQMPMLGLGTWALSGNECTRAVQSALELGYTHIDTAEMYDNEEAIGKAIEGVDRESLFITSKVWYEDLSAVGVISACENSLRRLGIENLDLYLIHWPKTGTDYRDCFSGFQELLNRGLIRAFGVSNFTMSHLEESISICNELDLKIACNQVEFHLGLYQRELLEFCDQNDIAITAYCPIAKGALVGDDVLGNIVSSHKKAATQIALRWLIQKEIVAIPKSSQRAHQASNLDIFDFELSDEEMSQLDALGSDQRLVEPGWAEF